MTARIALKASNSKKKSFEQKGTKGTKVRKKPGKVVHPDLEGLFWGLWVSLAHERLDLRVLPQKQFVFHSYRKWRFDFAWPEQNVAVEIEGGIFQGAPSSGKKYQTGHRSIGGVMKDMEKYNEAAILGWCVLRYHAKDLNSRPIQVFEEVLRALRGRS